MDPKSLETWYVASSTWYNDLWLIWIFYGKVKYGKMLEYKISRKVLNIYAKNVQMMTLTLLYFFSYGMVKFAF